MDGVIDGRFEVLSLAGEGGMGRVFRAIDGRDGSTVALKILRHDVADRDSYARFQREIDALMRLEHRAIVPYIAHGTTSDGAPYLAMRWIEGEELRVRLKRATLDVRACVAVATPIAHALAYAHAHGIMHRDVKPSNVLLRDGRLEGATLIDFGLARGDDDELTRTGALVGTPTYMAPEQIRSTDVSPAIDVFSLGCVIYQCLTGAPPFAAKGATAVLARVLFDEPASLASVVDVPAALAELVDAMLRKMPAERPSMQRVFEMLSELGAASPESRRVRERRDKLGVSEQRVVSVIVIGEPSESDENDTLRRTALPIRVDVPALARVATRFGGDMKALPNGAAVVVFTASSAATDLAAHAAECSLELKRHLQTVPLALATGRAEAGSSVPMGEAIDRAALLAPARGNGVRIDNVTAALLDARFVHKPDPHGALLMGRRETGAVRTLLGKPTPCVGRDAVLAMLEGIVTQSSEESIARVVIVTAPAGAGKSRIRHELLARLAARGTDAAVWITRGDSVSGGAPFGMAAQLIRRTTNILEGEPETVSRRKLLAHVGTGESAHRVAAFLGEIVQAHFPDDGDIQLQAARRDPRLMGDQMQRAFVELIDAECQTHPLLVVVEDLQWGDLPSVTALDTALRVCADRPLTVVGLARPEIAEVFPKLWADRGVQPIPLTPLSKKAAERLVRDVLAHTPSDVVDRIVDKAAGNAFYLEELIRAVFEGRDDMPATVVAMVQSRLGTLESEARRILRAAAVFGETFWEGSVRALVGDDVADLGRWLDELVGRELLTRRAQSRLAGHVEYVFRHALVREGAYAMLTDADRVLGHRLAAEWLEQVGEGAAVVIAEHFAKSGDARAVGTYLRAAEQALEGSDLVGAIERAQRGVDLGAEGETLGALRNVQAQAHHWRGETVEMEHAAALAIELLPRGDGRWAEAMALLGVAKQRLGHTGDLESVAESLSSALRAVVPPAADPQFSMLSAAHGNRAALARAGGRIASLLFFAGKQDLATNMLDVAEVAAQGGGVEVEARIHQARAPHARQAGRPADALAHAEAAEVAFSVAGDQRNACMMAGIRGFALSELGAYREAEKVLGEALVMAERLGLAAVAAGARSNLGIVFLQLGRTDEAEAIERAAIAAHESHDRRQEGGSRVYLAMILRDKGDLALAEEEARHALVLLDAAPALRPFAGAVLGTVLLAVGRSREALEITREAMRWFDAGGNVEEGDALLRLTLARGLVAVGDRTGASRVIAQARDRLLARAATIERPELKKTFLENVPQHAMTMKLAAEWC